jgi:hypothetical protein
MAGSSEGGERIEVWRGRDGLWRWRYRHPAEGVDLLSAEIYETKEAAVRASAQAFPAVEVEYVRGGGSVGRILLTVVALMAAAAILRGPIRLLHRWGTWRRRLGGFRDLQ